MSAVGEHEWHSVRDEKALKGGEDPAVVQPDEAGVLERGEDTLAHRTWTRLGERDAFTSAQAQVELFQPELLVCENLRSLDRP